MSEPSLDAFFDKLVEVLIHDVAFYIPSAIIPTNLLETIQNHIPANFLDEITILDTHQGMVVFEVDEFNGRIVQKPKSLENNIFQLLKKRKELEDFEFDYILKKYFEKVEFYSAMVDWLSVNLSIYNKKNIDSFTIGLFEIQSELYKTHFFELVNYFYQSKKIILKPQYDVSELLKVYFPDLISRLELYGKLYTIKSKIEIQHQEFKTKDENLPSSIKNITAKNQLETKGKLKKEPLISDKEAEEFILTKVFNLNLEAIHEYYT